MRPLIAEIKSNSLDDGPGVRSVVFFKGCPLSCVWCHNPECIGGAFQISAATANCLGCGRCNESCAAGAIISGPQSLNRELCTGCGDCVEACPADVYKIIGQYYPITDLANLLLRDKTFYDNSGGGVTLSGGEPTLYLKYCSELAAALKNSGVGVGLETCGDFDYRKFESGLAGALDFIYVDIKIVDSEGHKKYTGRGNERILENIRLMNEAGLPVLVRIPLIPGITSTDENLYAAAKYLAENKIKQVALLPFNPTWGEKAVALGAAPRYDRKTFMDQTELERARKIFVNFEIIGG